MAIGVCFPPSVHHFRKQHALSGSVTATPQVGLPYPFRLGLRLPKSHRHLCICVPQASWWGWPLSLLRALPEVSSMVCMRLGEGQCICTGENCAICGFLVYNTPMSHHNQYMLVCLGSPRARETPEHHAVRDFSTLRARRNRAP